MAIPLRHRTVATNGIRLHIAEAGPPSGKLVLLLHGFPESWLAWQRQMPALARAGFRVQAPDQRGYADSDKPARVADYDIERLVGDVVGLIDKARRRKAIVVGHDWGGLVAWWLALTRPQRVERLVILNVPHPAVMRRHLLTNPAQMMRSWYTLALQVPAVPEKILGAGHAAIARNLLARSGPFTRAQLAVYERQWAQPGAWRGMINWYRAAARRPRRRLPGPRVTVPTLLIWGAKDPYLGREMVEPSLALCDDARLEMIEDAGHFVQHEVATRVSRILLRHLAHATTHVSRAGV